MADAQRDCGFRCALRGIAREHMLHRFFSAHFDDGIGSCGGLMARLAREGHEVILHTVFGGRIDPPYSEFAKQLHSIWNCGDNPSRVRFAEDAAACQVIGCRQEVSGFAEAIYRCACERSCLYTSDETLFATPASEDTWLIRRLATEITHHSAAQSGRMYFPLAIGGHVDHRILHQAGVLCLETGLDVWFYRDFYYKGEAPIDIQALGLQRFMALFESCDFQRKLAAFLKYRSQCPMLFGAADAAVNYFETINTVPGSGRLFEELWVMEAQVDSGAGRPV